MDGWLDDRLIGGLVRYIDDWLVGLMDRCWKIDRQTYGWMDVVQQDWFGLVWFVFSLSPFLPFPNNYF